MDFATDNEKKMLLHICCGPCSMFVIDDLRDYFGEDFEIHGYYANPNIHPYEEFIRRLENCKIACSIKGIDLDWIMEFDQLAWENFEGPKSERCKMCYEKRMDMAAKFAFENGYEVFSTTLLVSPYQNHEQIKIAGEKAAEKYGIKFFYRDYSVGFRAGQQQAREANLYRQKYCGCIRSFYEDRKEKKK